MPSGVMSTTWDSFEEVLWSASYSGFIAAHALPSLERIAAFRAHPNAATVTGMLIAQVRRCLPPYPALRRPVVTTPSTPDPLCAAVACITAGRRVKRLRLVFPCALSRWRHSHVTERRDAHRRPEMLAGVPCRSDPIRSVPPLVRRLMRARNSQSCRVLLSPMRRIASHGTHTNSAQQLCCKFTRRDSVNGLTDCLMDTGGRLAYPAALQSAVEAALYFVTFWAAFLSVRLVTVGGAYKEWEPGPPLPSPPRHHPCSYTLPSPPAS